MKDTDERERRELQIDLVEIQVRIRVVSLFTAILFSAFISLFTGGYISGIDRITWMSIPYGIVAIILGCWLYNSPWKKLGTIKEKYIYPLEKASVLDSLLEDLDYRASKLEFQLKLIRECLDPDIKPFNNLALENGLTEAEYTQILDLMEEADQSIREGTPMGHGEFENRVSNIIPSRGLNYHFAESIVSTLNEEGRWTAVYKHMKEDGMNI